MRESSKARNAPMNANDLIAILNTADPPIAAVAGTATDQPTLVVGRDAIVAACQYLRDSPALGFRILSDITAVDRWPAEPCIEVVYHLASEPLRCRLRLKVRLDRAEARVPSITGLWPGANWLEREVWDLFGVVFEGHDDLVRLLMPEDWEGHPLRKDYPVQVRIAPRVYEPLQLTEEEFRRHVVTDRAGRRSIVESQEHQ